MSPESSPNRRRPSESLPISALSDLMDTFAERLFVHGSERPAHPSINTPHEVQFDFNTKAVQRLLNRTGQDDGLIVAEAYAVFEREGQAAVYDPRERQDTAVVIIINKLLAASPANDPIFQNTWYTFTADLGGRVDASYSFEFLQGGRPVMDTAVSTTMEERLFSAIHGSSDRVRPLFDDDEQFLRSLLGLIGR